MTNPKPSAARLEDIAIRVGVSRSEVSRVLNNRIREGKGVGPAMRERILEAARELNYRPHRAAQNLARGRTDTVALMMVIDRQAAAAPFSEQSLFTDSPGELSPHYHEIIGGLTYTLHQYGLHLLLAQCGGPDIDPISAMELIARSRACDGLVITDMLTDDPRPRLLDDTGLPFVVRGSSPQPNTVAVGMDNIAVGYQAVKYLYDLGHRHILFFNLRRDLMAGQRRYEGACRAAQECGIASTVEFSDASHTADTVYETLLRRLDEPNFPTAIFAEDEIAALGAERALIAGGLRVPDDVSVMTCLNARFMRLVAPHLTVLNVRQNEVAAQAAYLMGQMLRGETVPREQIFLSPILEEHGSTSAPRRSSI